MKSIWMKIRFVAKAYYYWLFVKLFGRIYYDSKYLKGKYYKKPLSIGWEWAYRCFWDKRRTKKNVDARWPVSSDCRIIEPNNISFDVDDINNFQSFGIYYQAIGEIIIGKGTYIAPNVGLITSNHDINNLDKHMPPQSIHIGNKCWIGMNSIILPGIILGDNTIVGAGSVVTKSFAEGNCVIAGNPAVKKKDLIL